jgi:transposase-like protein
LNNLIEQDHRAIKSRIGPMLGFKDFVSAQITLGGVELVHRIRQGRFALRKLGEGAGDLECRAYRLRRKTFTIDLAS